jgi:hypothetical protein
MRFALLLAIVTLTGIVASATAGALLQWSDGSVLLTIQPFTQTVFNGVVVNAYYFNNSYVALVAQPYYNGTGQVVATFTLYDYYTHLMVGQYEVSGIKLVSVPTNTTVIYVTVGGQTYGPYYIATGQAVKSIYSNNIIGQMLPPLLALGVTIWATMRSGSRNAFFGFVFLGIFSFVLSAVTGWSNPYLPLMGGFSLFFAALTLYLAARNSS